MEDQFKVGDPVVITGGAFYHKDVRTVIERETKLYWIVDGQRFRKSDNVRPGRRPAFNHSDWMIVPADD